MNSVTATGEDVVLERHGSVLSVDDVAWLLVEETNPFCELTCVGNSGRQEDVVDVVWQENDGLFPDDTAL